MPLRVRYCLLLGGLLLAAGAVAAPAPADSLRRPAPRPRPAPADVVDLANAAVPRLRLVPHDSLALARGGKFVALLPAVGYSQQTGGLVEVATNVAFQAPRANLSTILGALIYTAHAQAIFTATSSLWAAGNRWNFVGDWRIMHYPQSTYGLGMHTTTEQVVTMDYDYLRLYQSVLRRLAPNFYAGLGVAFDDHWNIVSRNGQRQVRAISRYRDGVSGRSQSLGPVLSLLYDSRTNATNAAHGAYLSAVYRPNRQSESSGGPGNGGKYQSLLLEGRAYLRPSRRSANVLAFWSYNALTLSGEPPFLDLPSTGWDMYSNLGRGYIQGRFRGKNLLYLESEYRFGITRNRLLGGVVFANAQSVSEDAQVVDEPIAKRYDKVAPAVGAGLRLSLNKVSRTNLGVDYARGIQGSSSLSFNVGEVF
ncbi:hypothetical protein ACFQ48_17745 [Hymenobacter caeli]|uniref:Bacterial surface antigen (D15) domain-containing protein n=1 Tax=Hymenobacter caeli TaxID=2735894 RepID=A0ABX2FUF1_9BACT|nr:hypothetical protein [Hymenobacter caeli]NRT20806.1 hypothetical protein [Hymenobacter caeli]